MISPKPLGSGLAVVAVVAMATTLVVPVAAAAQGDLEAAQRRANGAAAELAASEEAMAQADDAVVHAQGRVARADAQVARARDQVRDLAIRLYVEGTGRLTRILRMADTNQVVRAQQLTSVIAGSSTESLRRYSVDRKDLREELTALEVKQRSRAATLGDLRRRRTEAVTAVDRLAQLERQAHADEQRKAAVVSAATRPGPVPARQRPTAAPAPPAAPSAPAPSGPSSGWICPVQGPHAFSNDYGAPRGGGFRHQGNDILAPRGTPVVASVAGVVTQRRSPVSGLAYFLAGDDGNRYFGAHLDSFGASGRVAAGTVVGRVGNTGDASGGPTHLHFEIHPGGTGNVNPFPTLTRYC